MWIDVEKFFWKVRKMSWIKPQPLWSSWVHGRKDRPTAEDGESPEYKWHNSRAEYMSRGNASYTEDGQLSSLTDVLVRLPKYAKRAIYRDLLVVWWSENCISVAKFRPESFTAKKMKSSLLVGWLLNVPATCECIAGTDLLRQVYVLPHWDRSCRPNFPSHPVTVYWHRTDQSQQWPYNARRLAG